MKVNIKELNKLITLLLSNLKAKKGNEIELKNDYYWDIPNDQLYNPYEEPKELTLGQLSEDLDFIYHMSESKDAPIPYDLKKVAAILKALGIENPTIF